MRKIWLIFAQSVTVSLGLLFVLRSFYPNLLSPLEQAAPAKSRIVVKQVNPSTTQNSNPIIAQATYSNAAVKAMPAVVSISSSNKYSVQRPHPAFSNDPLFKRFFQEQQRRAEREEGSSLGSGVIVSPEGYVLTNHHVITEAEAIEITLADGRQFEASIVGTDPETDLAVLKIKTKDASPMLPAITFADSTRLKVGDVTLAIGNPFGVGQTVTQGIISALGRSQLGINTYENFIQTDASINPGNSGGALIDVDGHLIGINSAIYSRNGGSMGIGFAIPVSIAKKVMEQITVHGSVIRGWIGVEVQDLTTDLATSFKLKDKKGSLISGVLRNSPAHLGGLIAGDVLVSINDAKIENSKTMLNMIAALQPNAPATIGIIRDGQLMSIQIEVGKRPVPNT